MKPTVKIALGTIAYVALGSSAWSDGLRPLDETLHANTDPSYGIVRCAAFYTSMVEWAGQSIGRDTYDQISTAVDSLLFLGALVRSETSPDSIEHISQVVLTDARTIADLYLENYRVSYAETGNAWEGNPLWMGDLGTCEPVAQAAIEAAHQLGGIDQ